MHDDATFGITRRQALAALGGSACSFVSSPGSARNLATAHDGIARGTVFEARSGHGQRSSSSDPGLAGVMVSNGRDVVVTDEQGRWTLAVGDGDCIFVIKPPHWSIAATSTAPAGYYLHQPEGTPQGLALTSPQVMPTGPLSQPIHFALTRTPEPASFEALLVADTQAATAEELGYVRADMQSIASSTNAAFAIHHGDVMGDDLALFPGHIAITRETDIAWYHCPGNHDMNLESPSHQYAFEAWKRYIGPANSAFQYAGATFILLNNVEYFGTGNGSLGGRGYRGRIGSDQLQFVKNVLRNVPAEHLIVLSMHIPLVSFDNPDSISDTTSDRRDLMQLLSERPHCVSFSGHSHTTEHHYLGPEDGFMGAAPHHHHVLTAACGSWWSGPRDDRGVPRADSRDGSPRGVHVLSVDGNRYTTRFVPSPGAASPHTRTMLVKTAEMLGTIVATSGDVTPQKSFVLVDVFDGGPKTQVMCEMASLEAAPFELQRLSIADPYIVTSYAEHKSLCKPWVTPASSSHIWCGRLPEGVAPGPYDCTIHVVGEYGQRYSVRHVIDVTT